MPKDEKAELDLNSFPDIDSNLKLEDRLRDFGVDIDDNVMESYFCNKEEQSMEILLKVRSFSHSQFYSLLHITSGMLIPRLYTGRSTQA